MSSPDPQALARQHYLVQTELAAAAAAGVVGLLAAFDMTDIDSSWAAISGPVVELIASYQLAAALGSAAFFVALLRAADLAPRPEATVPPLAFAGYTAAGDSVATVVDVAPILMKVGIARANEVTSPAVSALPAVPTETAPTPSRLPLPQAQVEQAALQAATARVARIAASEVHDAGTGMTEAQMRLEPQASGYVRHVTLPACDRCLILAGRVYSASTGFLRHPQDDCVMVPYFGDQVPKLQSPRDLFHLMTDAQQDRAFGAAGARAIRDGADLSTVTNAKRGMNAPGEEYTRTAAPGARTRRHGPRRLSPQGVARRAGDDTVLYRRLLREHGYI